MPGTYAALTQQLQKFQIITFPQKRKKKMKSKGADSGCGH